MAVLASASPGLVLRPALAADLPAIQAIYAHHVLTGSASFEELPPDVAEMTRRWQAIQAAGLPYLVAEDQFGAGAGIAGYAYAGPYRPRAAYRFTVEDSIYLAPQAQGRGIGRALLARIIDDATALGLRQMIAVIGDSANQASVGLHRALGFDSVGTFRAVGFKFGRWVDSVLMQRALGAGATTQPDASAPIN
ncbi:phosphinothricin acetyltransferase [Dongia mobilis]|uniref:Phosphinothricin acetyltransferase n=1 Tax=Dongia mobilis TaxID=578943 RepID=A0A4R6WVJ0_9PROT|nr:GNAT family N-acetyltransferase [Dongia mobilis]TDQ84459.1 phosphinothricin acetyltransferase [Dongia mobilis]